MTMLKALRYGALTLLAGFAWNGAANAQLSAPTASGVVNGSYSVSYQTACEAFLPPGYYCQFVRLLEKAEPSGQWTVVSEDTGYASFSSKSPGSYSYVTWFGVLDPWNGYYDGYSAATAVNVTGAASAAPVRDNVLKQLDYRYEVRRGDFNGDNRTDLFVRKIAGGTPLNGTVETVILRQHPAVNGVFSAVVPSASQAALASTWALAPTIETRLHDIDVDGYVDLTLAKMASVVPGAVDYIVYSPGQPGQAQPGGLKPLDAHLTGFVGDAMDYLYDQDYFVKNAPTYYFEVWTWYSWCPYFGIGGMDAYYWQAFTYCYVNYIYYTGVYTDYSAFNRDAVALWTFEDLARSGQISKEQAAAAIKTMIEGILQSQLGGWPMEEVLGQVGEHTVQTIRRGIEAYQSILSAARAVPEHVDMDNLPPQTPREPGVIHVTGHKLMFDRGHLALEYAPLATAVGPYSPTTLSGEAEHWPPQICLPGAPSYCSWGKLLARTNKESDFWYLNFRVGHVLPFVQTPFSYWQDTLVPRHNRYMNLPYLQKMDYHALPDLAAATYNSNGYVRGLNGTGGFFVVPADMNSVYPGWNRPVPDAKFR